MSIIMLKQNNFYVKGEVLSFTSGLLEQIKQKISLFNVNELKTLH